MTRNRPALRLLFICVAASPFLKSLLRRRGVSTTLRALARSSFQPFVDASIRRDLFCRLVRRNPQHRCLHAIDQHSSPLSGSTQQPAVGYSPRFPTSTRRPLLTRGVAHLYARPSMARHGRRAFGAERTVALSSPYRRTSGARRATAIAYASNLNSIRSDRTFKRRHGGSPQLPRRQSTRRVNSRSPAPFASRSFHDGDYLEVFRLHARRSVLRAIVLGPELFQLDAELVARRLIQRRERAQRRTVPETE